MVRQYIGARYTIKVYTNSITPSSADWETGVSYEPITLVTFGGDSYLSKKPVPSNIGDPASNPDYWVIVGNTTAQIVQLEDKVAYLIARTYDTYTDAVADAGLYSEGDIIATLGYGTPGSWPALYIIHTTSAPQYISFGSKYAELAFYDDVISFDALGGGANPDNAMAVAFALIMANNAPSNIAQDIHRGGATIKFGRGYYFFNNKITIPSGLMAVTFEGLNHDTEIGYSGGDTLFDFVYSSSAYGDNINFRNLVFEGAGKSINFEYVRFSSIVNCVFANENTVHPSVRLSNCIGLDLKENYFMMADMGLLIRSNTTTVNIESCEFVTCNYGLQIHDSNGINIKDSIIEYNNVTGLEAYNSIVSIHNVWFEGDESKVTDTVIELIGNTFHTGDNSIDALIKVFNTTANKIAIYAPDVDKSQTDGVIIDNYAKYKGFLKFIDGDTIDFDARIITFKDCNNFNIFPYGYTGVLTLHGTYEVHGPVGSYFATFDIDQGTTHTITKLGGSIAAPDAVSLYGEVDFSSTIPDPTNTNVTVRY